MLDLATFIWNNALPYVHTCQKLLSTADAFVDIVTKIQNRDDELPLTAKVHVIFQAVFVAVQLTNIGVTWSARGTHAHLATTIATGLADIARTNTLSYLMEEHGLTRGIRLTTLAALHGSETFNISSELYPSLALNAGVAVRDTTKIITALNSLSKFAPNLQTTSETIFTWISDANTVLQPIVGPVQNAFVSAIKPIQPFLEPVQNALISVGSMTEEKRNELIETSTTAMRHIESSVQPLLEPIQNVFKSFGETALVKRDELVNASTCGVDGIYGGINIVISQCQIGVDTVVWQCKSVWLSMMMQIQSTSHATTPQIQNTSHTTTPQMQNAALAITVQKQEDAENALLQMLNHTNLDRIPRLYDNDTRFIYKCRISERPIRYIVVPNMTENMTPVTTWYEKVELDTWIRETPNIAPPSWPMDALPLPLRSQYVKICTIRQQSIDMTLHTVSTEIRAFVHERKRRQAATTR